MDAKYSKPGDARLFDVESGAEIKLLQGQQGQVNVLTYSPTAAPWSRRAPVCHACGKPPPDRNDTASTDTSMRSATRSSRRMARYSPPAARTLRSSFGTSTASTAIRGRRNGLPPKASAWPAARLEARRLSPRSRAQAGPQDIGHCRRGRRDPSLRRDQWERPRRVEDHVWRPLLHYDLSRRDDAARRPVGAGRELRGPL